MRSRALLLVHMLSKFAQKIGFQEYLGAKTSDISSEETKKLPVIPKV